MSAIATHQHQLMKMKVVKGLLCFVDEFPEEIQKKQNARMVMKKLGDSSISPGEALNVAINSAKNKNLFFLEIRTSFMTKKKVRSEVWLTDSLNHKKSIIEHCASFAKSAIKLFRRKP